MAKLDKRTVKNILNESSLKGMNTKELSSLEAELQHIKNLKDISYKYIEFDKFILSNKTLVFKVNLDKLTKFYEVNWEYEMIDKENKVSKNVVDLESSGTIYIKHERYIHVKFNSIHAEYMFDEKNSYNNLTGEMIDKEYLIEQCEENDSMLIEAIKKELINYELLEKAGIKLHFELFNGNDYGGFYSIVENKIKEAMKNLYSQSYKIYDDFLRDVMDIEKTIRYEMEDCIERVFGYSAMITTSNLYKFAKERFIISVSKEFEEKLDDFTDEGVEFLFALFSRISEKSVKKALIKSVKD